MFKNGQNSLNLQFKILENNTYKTTIKENVKHHSITS